MSSEHISLIAARRLPSSSLDVTACARSLSADGTRCEEGSLYLRHCASAGWPTKSEIIIILISLPLVLRSQGSLKID